ncbi:MAG: hypothetical protein AAFX06_33130 [Planctomycetota bacterium]
MRKTLQTIFGIIAAAFLLAAPADAAIIYSMDFSTPGQGVTHDNSSGSTVFSAPSPFSGANWTLTYDSTAVSSDGSPNEFITDVLSGNNGMLVQDWGGDGTITSDVINITENGTVDIIGIGTAIGTDAFNFVGTEGITWFYSLNSAAPVTLYLGETELGGPVAEGTDIGNTFSGIGVAAGDTLEVGFTVNVNGANDGAFITALDVDFITAIPEPSSFVALALVSIPVLTRRRNRKG